MADKPQFRFAKPDGVNIRLDGKVVTLRYTLGASKAIDQYFGGIVPSIERLQRYNTDDFVHVIRAAAGQEVTEDSVFMAGIDSLFLPLREYLTWLSNGGRAPVMVDEQKAVEGNG